MYYDPMLDVDHRRPIQSAVVTCFYAAPQQPDDSRRLFDAAASAWGLAEGDLPRLFPSRAYPIALLLSREWELPVIEERLSAAIDEAWEPTWDRSRGEFTWGLGLDEAHPRGQFNAFLAAAEAGGPGAWTRLSAAPLDPCPQVVGVDFPKMALARAEWADGALHLGLAPLAQDPTARTEFTVVGADRSREWTIDGPQGSSIDATDDGLVVTVPITAAAIRIR